MIQLTCMLYQLRGLMQLLELRLMNNTHVGAPLITIFTHRKPISLTKRKVQTI